MPEISKITLPSGTTYDIKDATARASMSGAIVNRGESITAITDWASTNPITIAELTIEEPTDWSTSYTNYYTYSSTTHTFTAVPEGTGAPTWEANKYFKGNSRNCVANDAVFYIGHEFVFDGTAWHEFGDMSGLGALASKDSASGSFTPSGTVSQPSFTGSSSSVTISAEASESGNYTPAGSVAAPTISVSSAGATTSITPVTAAGSMPTYTVSNETLTISAGAVPTLGSAINVKTGDASYEATAPAFTGTKVSLTGTTTASGTVSQPSFAGTAGTVTVS